MAKARYELGLGLDSGSVIPKVAILAAQSDTELHAPIGRPRASEGEYGFGPRISHPRD